MAQSFDTALTPTEEAQFRVWKAKYAPTDSGEDYDLRGAFKEGLTPDPKTGHWPDTYKKPNHPTFSVESKYASAAPDKAGRWEGDKYVPAGTDDVSKAIEMFKGLPEDRQAALLTRMTPEQKDKILAGLKARTGPAPSMVEGQKAVIASDLEKANPGSVVARNPSTGELSMTQPGTVASRAREAAIGVLEPLSGQALLSTLKEGGQALWDMATGKGTGRAQEMVKGAVTAPVQPVQEFVEGVHSGNYEQAAHGAGGTLSQTAPAVSGVVEGVKAGGTALADAADLRNKSREFVQNRVGANALKTTEPAVAKYNEAAAKTPAAQAESDAATAERNRLAQEAAAKKTTESQAKVTGKNEAAMNAADIETEQNQAKIKADNERMKNLHAQKVAEATEHNRNVLETQNRARVLDSNLKEGSQQLGTDLVDLDAKLRQEANGKYAEFRKEIKDDPGVPLSEMAQAAKEAEGKLKGSSENIKQFRDLIRKGPEESGVASSLGELAPGDPLFERLKEEGAIDEGGNLPFDQLQGYSSEIGRRLAEGVKDGDVYQALKYLKEKIDAAKEVIAKRNNVSDKLHVADNFYNKYMDAMYDQDSAVAQTRRRVGVLDPEFYAEPFTKGKAAGVGVDKLKAIPSKYVAEISKIADAAQRLKAYHAELKGIKIPAEKPIPEAPTPRQAGPRAMATLQPIPEPVTAETTPRTVVKPPEEPTAGQILGEKAQKVQNKAQSVGELHRANTFELLSIPVKSIISNVLRQPAVIDWIAKPTAADLAAIEKLPDPIKSKLRGNLQKIIADEKAAGKTPSVSPWVQQFIRGAAVASGGVNNRREAMEVMGQKTP